MTIEEAIQHCEENSVKEKNNGNEACSIEHMQLRNWLSELKHIKESQSREVYKNTFIELKDDSGSIYVRQEDNICVIHSLTVRPKLRKKGNGTLLLQEAENTIICMGFDKSKLYVKTKSWMKKWYEHMGYQEIKSDSIPGFSKMIKNLK